MLAPCHDAVRGTCLPGGQLHLSFNHTHPLQQGAELLPQCVQLRTGRAADRRLQWKASTVLTALPRAGQQPADELSRAQHTLPYKAAPAEHCPPLPAHLHDHVGSNTVRCM